MKKRLISLLCTLSIAATFCTQTLYAADTAEVTESTAVTETNSETTAKIKTLQGLGILGISKKMTYEAFVYSLAGFCTKVRKMLAVRKKLHEEPA